MFEAFIDTVGGEEHAAYPQNIYSKRRRAMTGSPPLERKEYIPQRHDLVIMTKRREHRRGPHEQMRECRDRSD
jgi:hypothetical protein